MVRSIKGKVTAAVIAVACTLGATHASALSLKISVTNNTGKGGLTLTPLLAMLHNGTFDTFSPGSKASAALEALAEDGNAGVTGAALAAAQPKSTSAVITAPQGFAGAPLIEPGETGSVRIDNVDAATQGFFSYLSMILPSNDQFIGNGNPLAHALFDAKGQFLGPQTINVSGLNAYDAGTEVNNGLGSPFAQLGAGASVDEGGVVSLASGIDNFAGLTLPNGQVLGTSPINYAGNAAFSLATISITAVPLPAGLPLMLGGLALFGMVARRKKPAATA